MPATLEKNPSGGWIVRTPNGIHSKHASLENAKKQQRLLNALDHGFKPTKRK